MDDYRDMDEAVRNNALERIRACADKCEEAVERAELYELSGGLCGKYVKQ